MLKETPICVKELKIKNLFEWERRLLKLELGKVKAFYL